MPVSLPAPAGAFLDQVDQALERIGQVVEEELGGLEPELLLRRPGEGRWSPAHCLAHLERTNALYREALSESLDAQAAGAGEPGELRGSFFGRIFAGMVGPDPAFRVRTPRVFRPESEAVGRGALAAFLEEQARWRELVASLRGLPLDRIRVTSPASRMVRLRASDVLAVVVNHEERHLAQARAAAAAPQA